VECEYSAGNETLYSGTATFFAYDDVASYFDVR
jgi:hypothetical protein